MLITKSCTSPKKKAIRMTTNVLFNSTEIVIKTNKRSQLKFNFSPKGIIGEYACNNKTIALKIIFIKILLLNNKYII